MIQSPFDFNIILAEDDPDDVLFFELAIKDIGDSIKIRHAANGDKLIELLNERVPDFLFLDIHMPCKGGLECIKEIRSNSQFDRMPVIMITFSDFSRDVHNAYLFGASLYIFKTVKIDDLVLKLKQIFSIDWQRAVKPPLSDFVL
jgi:CheY-like chemotaxis protein